MEVILEFFKSLNFRRAIMSIILFAVCLIAIKLILIFFDKVMKKSKTDELVRRILRVVIKSFLWFPAIIITLSSLGISVSSLIATLSVIGVAFSLAIQGFLGNVFGGIQIISNHPFKIGDYVEAGGEAGTVREVGLFYTKLDTPDNKLIQIPNSRIVGDSIINYSNADRRRLEFLFSVSYESDVETVQKTMLKLLEEHPLIIKEEDVMPVVHVNEFKDSDISYTARAWCENEDYWTVYFDIMDAIKPTFDKNGVAFSYPNVNVRMITKD